MARETEARTEATALEDARTELAALRRELAERTAQVAAAREQQAATAEILRAISAAPADLRRVLDAIAERAARLCGADDAGVARLEGDRLFEIAHHGGIPRASPDALAAGLPVRGSFMGRAVLGRRTLHVHDAAVAPEDEFPLGRASHQRTGQRTTLATPLLRDGEALGAILVRRLEVRPFTDEQIRLLETFADQAVIAIENARLFSELQASNAALTAQKQQLQEALEQQTATSEILRAIAASPADLQPVLQAIVDAAARLCGTQDAMLSLREGGALRHWAGCGALVADYLFPTGRTVPLDRQWVNHRAVLEARTVHLADVLAEPEHEYGKAQDTARQHGFRTVLAVPLRRGADALGALVAWRLEVRPFTARQIALLESFADQAVVAIENARLFGELQERLAEQTATSDILRAIRTSPSALQPVLDAIVGSVVGLCEAQDAVIFRRDGDALTSVARVGPLLGPGTPVAARAAGGSRPIERGWAPGRAVLEQRSIHFDATSESDAREFPESHRGAQSAGFQVVLVTPLLSEGAAIGAISVLRAEARPFTERHRALLQTFADQAVIAIENARLFGELQESNATLTEKTQALEASLEQQTATADILRAIAASPGDAMPVAEAVVERSVRLCGADNATLRALERGGQRVLANAGDYGAAFTDGRVPDVLRVGTWTPVGDPLTALAVAQRRTVHAPALDQTHPDHPAVRVGVRCWMVVPLVRAGEAVGHMHLRRFARRPFTEQQIALVETFAAQAVIALENARLFQELNESNATLREALEQQTATAEVLGVMSRAPADAQPIFDAIAQSIVRLTDSSRSTVFLREGDRLWLRAAVWDGTLRGEGADEYQLRQRAEGQPLDRGWVAGRAVLEGRTVHVPDLGAAAGEYPVTAAMARTVDLGSILAAPLLTEDGAVGVISSIRAEPRPFAPSHVALLETFAAQAVIALENARLFQELHESNATLTEALEQQTATSDILRIISRSPTDVRPVLDAITERAALLCGAGDAIFHRADPDGATMRMVASYGRRAAEIAAVTAAGPVSLTRGRLAGRAILDRRTVRVADMAAEDEAEYAESKALQRRFGFRSVVATPVLREGSPLGAISLRRFEVDPFNESQVKLLETFADQAAIAIENARLFSELEQRDARRRQELERAATIQQRLLPASVGGWPGVLEIAVRFRPAVETSGDFYDVLRLAPSAEGALPPLQLAVGDVAGKGMSAALVTALARSALQASASVPTGMATPANTLRVAGQRLHRDVGAAHFVACSLAVLEPPGRHHRGPLLRLANAAQAPVLLARDGGTSELEPPGYRLPLGAEDDGAYEDTKVELRPGDVVVFSSDGLAEAPALAGASAGGHLPPPAQAGELFGFDRLASSVAHWSQQAADAEGVAAGVWADLTAWCGKESHHDDMTLLVLRVPLGTAGGASAGDAR